MFDSEYISCPIIGFHHTLLKATKEYEAVNGSPQWDVLYPTPEQPAHSPDSFEELIEELEAAYDEYVEEQHHAFELAYDEFLNDEDALLHRPDDDPADQPCQDGLKGWCSCDECSELADEEPACGDCGGCCECLGDPEVEPRFDTLHEQEEFYRETS